jgi:alpha-L-rhamnosidase
VILKALTVLAALTITGAAFAGPVHLRCEYLEDPIGVDRPAPRLSWESDSSGRNWQQSAYQIFVADNPESLQAGRANIWDSGRVDSSQSVGVVYGGPKLESRKRYFWKVRVWDTAGELTESRRLAWWEMGLLNLAEWKAHWIARQDPEAAADSAALRWIWMAGQNAMEVVPGTKAVFRAKFEVSERPLDGALLIAARGNFVAALNGKEVCRKRDWHSFDRCDLTEVLAIGQNTLEIKVTSPEVPSFGPGSESKTMPAALAAIVKVVASDGKITRYPANSNWEAKLEGASDWGTAEVAATLGDQRMGNSGPLPEPASYFRKDIESKGTIRRARLYVTALGSYEFFLNGQRVGEYALTPEFTDYRKRVIYQSYDVTRLVVPGKNVLACVLGDGWYGSALTWVGLHFFLPPDRLLAQLELEYSDGRRETIASDDTWKASASPVVWSDVYAGEIYDARQEQEGWQSEGFDDTHWSQASIISAPVIDVSSQITPPARVVMTVRPKTVTQAADGSYIFDMGQNMVGWAVLKVKGKPGTRVRLRFAEILKPDGTIYTENLRNAEATDVYVLKGGGEETFRPHFTFHGFRYIAVTGAPSKPALDTLSGEVVSSVGDQPSAAISTSSELVNRMWSIGIWGQRGNFLSIPTDCPQRDERLGWMGDAGVFWRTGSYNFDIASFSQKFGQDIVDAQTQQGAYSNVSPNVLPFGGSAVEGTSAWSEGMVGAPGWGDAGVIVPWTTWVQYGDTELINRNWDSMERWMKFIQDSNPEFLRKNGVGPNFADWLAPDEHTDKVLLATGYWALITEMMSQMAHALGRQEDAKRYQSLFEQIRGAFERAYIKDDGTVGTGTQTSYVVTLYTKLAPKNLEPKLMQNLVKDIESRDWHLSTGFLGTPFLLFVLTDHGRADVAYRLLLNETYPSWGYMLSKGATTWWERWNGDTGDPAMNSYNHYAFGSVVAWVYRSVLGIDTSLAEPGFRKIVVRPQLDSQMNFAKGEYNSIYGRISTEWTRSATGKFQLKLTIPANTRAEVYLPAKAGVSVVEGQKNLQIEPRDGFFPIEIGSGTYDFTVQ